MSKIKVALAQIDFKPAFYLNQLDMLIEPHGDESTTISELSYSGSSKLKRDLRMEYIKWIKSKIIPIIKTSARLNVELIVFPEYSIPPEILNDIVSALYNSKTVVVAGTHIVTNLAMDLPSQYPSTKDIIGCAICPILTCDGLTYYTFKTHKAGPEIGSLKIPRFDVIDMFDFPKFKMQVKICIDAIIGGTLFSFDKDNKGILAIPSYSIATDPFYALSVYSKYNEIPVIYTNCAKVGGSFISGAFSKYDNHWYAEKFTTRPVPKDNECLITVTFDLDRMYETKGTTNTASAAKIDEVVNILYSRDESTPKLIKSIDEFCSNFDEEKSLDAFEQCKMDIIMSEKVRYLSQMKQNGLLDKQLVENVLSYIKINNFKLKQFMNEQDKHIFSNFCGNMQHASTDPKMYTNMSVISLNISKGDDSAATNENIIDDDSLFLGRDNDISSINDFYNSTDRVLLLYRL